jgi:quercetin dioxygenase-like cupin family protein
MVTTAQANLSRFWLALSLTGVLTALVLFGATAASAGQCPPGKETADGQKPGATAHKGVKEEVLGQIDLAKEKVNVPGRLFRMRRLVVQPGGEVAWHSHADRPALIYTVSGTITEYSSHCAVPIVHRAGDLSIEQAGLSHWWKNTSKEPVTLISADIAADPNNHDM